MVKHKMLLLFGLCLLVIVSCGSTGAEYHCALGDIPRRIDPIDSNINYALYVLEQLNEPLFYFNPYGKPDSKVLQTWVATDGNRSYTLCVKEDLTFSNGRVVTAAVVKDNLQYFSTKRYLTKKLVTIDCDKKCVKVSFAEPYPHFREDLSSYKTSIIDPDTIGMRVVVGISPYYVAEISDKVIHLKAQRKMRYRDIYFHYWRPNDGRPLHEYDDINLIYERDIPPNIENYMVRYNVSLLRTEVMLINVEDEQVRKILFNCIDIDELRNIIHPKGVMSVEVAGVLPIGIRGAVSGRVKQECSGKPLHKRVSVKLLTFYENSVDEFREYFNKTLNGYGIDIEVIAIQPNDLMDVLTSGEKKYDMTIVGMDAPYPDAMAYMKYFLPGEDSLTNVQNDDLMRLMAEYSESKSEDEKELLARQANMSLVDNHQTLPLLQVKRPFYYSKKIHVMPADQLFIGMPKISEL